MTSVGAATTNLKFEYLHRDEGNYKTFGSVIFKNPNNLSIEEATILIQDSLIDGEFFEPNDVIIPLFESSSSGYVPPTDWYEFDRFSFTEEEANDPRTIEHFINDFKRNRNKISG